MERVLVTGASGQLGRELFETKPAGVEAMFCSRSELDITDRDSVARVISDFRPDALINAAAYTAVDRAEEEKDIAFRINSDGPATLAQTLPSPSYLLHISTDFVFDGEANRPYQETAKTTPTSIYGDSKLAGEKAITEARRDNWATIRTSWVYSSLGNNFVKTMLKYMDQRDELGIVVDQVGSPTWAKDLANTCWLAVEHRISGLHHWSDAGAISWFDFANEIQRLGVELGLLGKECKLNAIPTEAYPLPAKRPAYSVLDKTKVLSAIPGLKNRHWQKNLRKMMQELAALEQGN